MVNRMDRSIQMMVNNMQQEANSTSFEDGQVNRKPSATQHQHGPITCNDLEGYASLWLGKRQTRLLQQKQAHMYAGMNLITNVY
jgi:hypothetical protein